MLDRNFGACVNSTGSVEWQFLFMYNGLIPWNIYVTSLDDTV